MQSGNRNDTRQTFFDVWRKLQNHEPLSMLETIVAEVIRLHSEYQPLLDHPGEVLDRDWRPEGGETNPFLHMGLHIAIREQLSIDRPTGVNAVYAALLKKTGDIHAAEHLMLESLAESLWRAQREGRLPDEQTYLASLRSRAGK